MGNVRSAQDRFLARKFGVFNHFLYGNPSDGVNEAKKTARRDWNKCVAELDVERIARMCHEVGAGYYCITLMQGTKYMLAPNAAYDRVAGTKPGEACPERDVVMDLADALAKYDIDLYLYFTGDGPHLDEVIGPRFGFGEPRGHVTMDFVLRWAEVLREYALRYGSKVKGWWIDGCYREFFHYNDEMLKIYYDACKAGNPDCLVTFNDGVFETLRKNYPDEDFVAGEFNDFEIIPESRFIDGAQTHILAPLGVEPEGAPVWGRWRKPGARRDGAYMLDYVRRANAAGMPVTIDVYVSHAGEWDPAQYDVLKTIGDGLK